ncbi:hypothetical protein CBL_00797 [Carabus blaptoides fortunei]
MRHQEFYFVMPQRPDIFVGAVEVAPLHRLKISHEYRIGSSIFRWYRCTAHYMTESRINSQRPLEKKTSNNSTLAPTTQKQKDEKQQEQAPKEEGKKSADSVQETKRRKNA